VHFALACFVAFLVSGRTGIYSGQRQPLPDATLAPKAQKQTP
jgi:hypothetical protein